MNLSVPIDLQSEPSPSAGTPRGTPFVRAVGLYALLGGAISLAGWFVNVPRLTDWLNTGLSMMPNTALCAALAGLAMLMCSFGHRRSTRAVGLVVAAIGVATLFEHITQIHLGIDTLLIQRDWGQQGTVAPGRMGVPGSTSFALIGLSLFLILGNLAMRRAAIACSMLVAGVALLSIIGYASGADLLFTVPRLTAIALQTAAIVLALAIGVIAALPDQQPMRTLMSDTAAGLLARRTLPFIILMPIVVGWLRLKGQEAGLYDTAFGTGLRTLVEVTLLIVVLWIAVSKLASYEREQRRRADRVSAFLETAPIGLHRVAEDGTILWANDAELNMLGFERHEYVGRNIAEFHADKHLIARLLSALGNGEKVREFEARLVCKDGTVKEVLIDSSVLVEHGRILHTQCFTRDVTGRKRADEAKALLAEIVNASDDAIISKSLDGTIRSWNAGAERLFGYRADEAIGQSIHLIIPPDLRSEEVQILDRLKRGERIDHYETTRLAKDGQRRHISITVSPVRDKTGQIIGASKVARDITERKRVEVQLARHAEQLERAVSEATQRLQEAHARQRTSERFAALGTLSSGLGHDIANLILPLRANLDSIQSMIRPEAMPAAEERLQSLRKSLDYLRSLAQSLRLLSVDPETRFEVESDPFDLNEWWVETEPLLRTALGRRLVLQRDFEGGRPLARVRVSKALFTQGMFNLIQNAAQALAGPPATENGWVRVSAQTIPGIAGTSTMLRITVADNGPGMEPHVRERCLEPFFTTKSRGLGTGMGLALVQGVVSNAGGTIEIRSQPGHGTAFVLTLPADEGVPAARNGSRRAAVLKITDVRTRALTAHTLSSLRFQFTDDIASPADVLVIGGYPRNVEVEFLERNPRGQVLRIGNGVAQGEGTPEANGTKVIEVPAGTGASELRRILQTLATQGTEP